MIVYDVVHEVQDDNGVFGDTYLLKDMFSTSEDKCYQAALSLYNILVEEDKEETIKEYGEVFYEMTKRANDIRLKKEHKHRGQSREGIIFYPVNPKDHPCRIRVIPVDVREYD